MLHHDRSDPTPGTLPSDGYGALTPTWVLDALSAAGFVPDGRLLQLNSYENRVFQLYLDDGSAVVAKFYRPARWTDDQILEEHAFALELLGADVPVVAPCTLPEDAAATPGLAVAGVPPTLATLDHEGARYRYSISPRRAGRAPDLENLETLEWLGRFIGRLHAIGATLPFRHRRTLDVATWGDASMQLLTTGGFVPPDQLPAWQAACTRALELARAALHSMPRRTLRLHGDCHPGNILWRDEGPHIVDLDDACNGPAVQDLWMLLSGDRSTFAAQCAHLLDGYRMFMPFDERELALIEPLRTLRMVHHSAWIAHRWADPAFPITFPWFGSAAYWSEQTTQLREQIEAMEAASG